MSETKGIQMRDVLQNDCNLCICGSVTALDKPSARSKVMDSWTSGWKSIEKTPPVLPVIDIQMTRSQKVNKSDKRLHHKLNRSFDPTKVITKENSIKHLIIKSKTFDSSRHKDKVIDTNNNPKESAKNSSKDMPKDSSNDIIKEKTRELRQRLNTTQIDVNLKDSVKESINEKSVLETNCKNNETKSEKNPILSKLRKRKTDSRSPSLDIESHKSVSVTKSDKSLEENKNKSKELPQKPINSSEKEKSVDEEIKMISTDVERMEVDITPMKTCVRPNCYNRVNRFYLFEGKFCSSDCALKQWTEDFQSRYPLNHNKP